MHNWFDKYKPITWRPRPSLRRSCQAQYTVPDNVHHPHVQQPFAYEKPEAASAVLGSWWWAVCLPKHAELHTNT